MVSRHEIGMPTHLCRHPSRGLLHDCKISRNLREGSFAALADTHIVPVVSSVAVRAALAAVLAARTGGSASLFLPETWLQWQRPFKFFFVIK